MGGIAPAARPRTGIAATGPTMMSEEIHRITRATRMKVDALQYRCAVLAQRALLRRTGKNCCIAEAL
jgi:hypothetical protein